MSNTITRIRLVGISLLSFFTFALIAACVPTTAQDTVTQSPSGDSMAQPSSPVSSATEATWPRVVKLNNQELTIYPPNFQSWDGHVLTGTCAFSLATQGATTQTFGTLAFSANSEVDRATRMVMMTNIQVVGLSLPENPAAQSALQSELASSGSGKSIQIALDRLEAQVPNMTGAPTIAAAALQNTPPAIFIVMTPTVLVPMQGAPVLQAFEGTDLQRVLNTPMLLVQDAVGGCWLKIADGWMTASSWSGVWSVATPADAGFAKITTWALQQPSINLLAPATDGTNPGSAATAQTHALAQGAPTIVVAASPTEIIVTQGAPQWEALGSSGLLFASNTSGNIFQLQATGTIFVLLSGRWFTANTMAGPWSFMSTDQLPGAFMMIPNDSPKENVLASVPGTAQAQEATIANAIPQMARIPLTQTIVKPVIIGSAPLVVPISGSMVSVVQNCSTPIFMLGANNYYCVQNGVWFQSVSLSGSWKVAGWIPPAIYTIPPSSPYYYVTYVKVYQANSDYVLVGYTPGYLGAYTQGGVVVYGTGYVYAPYCTTVWVPAPVTYGYGASMCYNPWAGWAVGFGMGMAVGWAISSNSYHYGPYWGPYCGGYGVHGWAATTGNVYHQWGSVSTMSRSSAGYNSWTGNQWSTHTGTAYNSTTGARAAGQTGSVHNAYTGNWAEGARGAGYNPTTGDYAAGKGGVAGTPGGATVAAGAGTIGNTKTGQSVSAAGVKTDNGSWGVAHTDNGTAVKTPNNVYGTSDGNAYRYNDSSNSWEQHQSGDNWSSVNDQNTKDSLNQQQASRADGDARASNSNRWQSGGDGFTGNSSAAKTSTSGNSWGGSGGNSGANRSSGSRGGRGGGRR